MSISPVLWTHNLFSDYMCSTYKEWQVLLLAANHIQVGVCLGNAGQKGSTLLGNESSL